MSLIYSPMLSCLLSPRTSRVCPWCWMTRWTVTSDGRTRGTVTCCAGGDEWAEDRDHGHQGRGQPGQAREDILVRSGRWSWAQSNPHLTTIITLLRCVITWLSPELLESLSVDKRPRSMAWVTPITTMESRILPLLLV